MAATHPEVYSAKKRKGMKSIKKEKKKVKDSKVVRGGTKVTVLLLLHIDRSLYDHRTIDVRRIGLS